MSARLLVSISSIFDTTRTAAQRTYEELAQEGIPASLLVAPHITNTDSHWRLATDERTLEWLRQQDTLILNGFDTAVQGRRAEFAALDEHEAQLRLKGATRQLAVLGLEPTIFAPPRWQLSEGTLAVAPEFGFKLVGSEKGLYCRNDDSWTFITARTLSVGEGFGAPRWWRRNLINAARRGAGKGKLVRLSASARNLVEDEVRADFISAAKACVEEGAVPMRYDEVTGPTGASISKNHNAR